MEKSNTPKNLPPQKAKNLKYRPTKRNVHRRRILNKAQTGKSAPNSETKKQLTKPPANFSNLNHKGAQLNPPLDRYVNHCKLFPYTQGYRFDVKTRKFP